MKPKPFCVPLIALVVAASALTVAAPAQAAQNFGARVSANASNIGGAIYNGGTGFGDVNLDRAGPYGNNAAAEANLRDGALHVYANSPRQSQDCWLGVPRSCVPSRAESDAEFWDVITFHAADLRDPSQVRWKFTFTGEEDDGPWKGVGGGAYGKFAYYISTKPFNVDAHYAEIHPNDSIGGSFVMPSGPDASLTIYIWAGMQAEAWNGGYANYSHTGRFTWELPAGVSYTSSSGEFMADHPLPVPEPASFMLMGLGLAVLPALRRRGQRARA